MAGQGFYVLFTTTIMLIFSAHSSSAFAAKLPKCTHFCSAKGTASNGDMMEVIAAGISELEATENAQWACEIENELAGCMLVECWATKNVGGNGNKSAPHQCRKYLISTSEQAE